MPFYDAFGNELEMPQLGGPVLEVALNPMPALAAAMDFGVVAAPAQRVKLLYIVVTTPFAWVTAGQPTVQGVCGRSAAAAPDSYHPLLNSFNLGPAAATSLAAQLWVVTSSGLVDLAFPHPFFGIRLNFPSAPSAGAASLYLECGAY